MSKIGNSLSGTMERILKGELNYEELDTIYAGTCFTREEAAEIISHYKFYWKNVAHDRAEMELGEDADYKECRKRAEELLPEVTLEAEKLLQQLLDDNKIVQTRYRVPEGQTVDVEYVMEDGTTDTEKVFGNGEREVTLINGQLYNSRDGFSLGVSSSEIFNNELELIANQISQRGSFSGGKKRNFEFLLAKMFPQYESAIRKMYEYIRNKEEYGFVSEEELLKLVHTPEHTAEEIGEAITPGMEHDALKVIVDEMDKEKSGPEGH